MRNIKGKVQDVLNICERRGKVINSRLLDWISIYLNPEVIYFFHGQIYDP